MSLAFTRNLDPTQGQIQQATLQNQIAAQGNDWAALITERCPHLFSPVKVFIEQQQYQKMADVIAAIHRVTHSPAWQQHTNYQKQTPAEGVFFGYDFHLSEHAVQLIEINTNAGGGWLNALLQHSQNPQQNIRQIFLEMFLNEWHLVKPDQILKTILITDKSPEQQYLYPELLLAQQSFQQAGYQCLIADPNQLQLQDNGLFLGEHKIDLVYNRLTDFYLDHYPALKQAYLRQQIVLTPHPQNYQQFADKRNLAWLTDQTLLQNWQINPEDINCLQTGIPHSQLIEANLSSEIGEQLWEKRKQYFFKPWQGYGSKGAYAGNKLTKRVFAEILQGNYLAQQLAPPAQRAIHTADNLFKYDIRCYTYKGEIQLIAARLYQGQTTNFRTQDGGFACVEILT